VHSVYLAADPIEASIVCDYLREHGIDAHCLDQHAWGGRGELPVNAFPRVAVSRESEVARAKALIKEYEKPNTTPAWRCPACGERVEGQFAVCWNCGAQAP
jgi:hypothetical protein